MRTRRIILLGIVLPLVAWTAPPAAAQEVHFEIAFGRAAVAFWEDHQAETFGFVVAGQGVLYTSDAGRPLVGDVGCAAVGTFERHAFGCGELSDFAIDTDLGTAAATGKLDALVFDEGSARASSSAISFSVDWKATSDPSPRSHAGYYADDLFVGTYLGAEVARYAIDGTKGHVSAPGTGRNPSELVDAAILVGPNFWVDLVR